MKLASTTILFAFALCAHAEPQNAEAIIQRMGTRYSTVKSYQDTGVLMVRSPNQPEREELHFRTYFAAPINFRFEWVDHDLTPTGRIPSFHVIWSNGRGAFSCIDDPNRIEPARNLSMAIAQATGVATRLAGHVPQLLTKEIRRWRLTDLQALTFVAQTEFDGTVCYRVRGVDPARCSYELWIGVDDFILRRIQVQNELNIAYDEIHRDIQIDSVIPESTFQFEPPK